MRTAILFCLVATALVGCGPKNAKWGSSPVTKNASPNKKGVGQGNGLTYQNDVMQIRFSYPSGWKLTASRDLRQVKLDNSPLVGKEGLVSEIQFSLSPGLFDGKQVKSTEDLLAQLQNHWPERSWSYVVFRTGQTGYAWKGPGENPYVGEYYLLDPNLQILKVSYRSYVNLQGSQVIDRIVASMSVVDRIDCDVIVGDPAGRPVYEGTDQLTADRVFDLEGTDERAPNGTAHFISTKGAVSANHAVRVGTSSVSVRYSLSYRLALLDFVNLDTRLDKQASCFSVGMETNGQTLSDGCIDAGDDPEMWADEPLDNDAYQAPYLDLDLAPAKAVTVQGVGTMQVQCRANSFLDPNPQLPLAYAYRDPGADGRLVHLEATPGSTALRTSCGSAGADCRCFFATTPDQEYLPDSPKAPAIVDPHSGELTCRIPDSVNPGSVRYVEMFGPGGWSGHLILLATIPPMGKVGR